MKEFKNRRTGEIVIGTFKESPKILKEKGYDWNLIEEDGNRELFGSLEEFTKKYSETLNPLYEMCMNVANQFIKKMRENDTH